MTAPTITRPVEGHRVTYRGSRTDLHGPMIVMAVYANGTLRLTNAGGVLFGVRPESVRTEES